MSNTLASDMSGLFVVIEPIFIFVGLAAAFIAWALRKGFCSDRTPKWKIGSVIFAVGLVAYVGSKVLFQVLIVRT